MKKPLSFRTEACILKLYNYINGGESIATMMMWAVYLINAIVMFVKWRRDVKVCNTK